MSLQGKGFMIWKVRDCESGNVASIASEALQSGLTHVMIKIADGTSSYNIDSGVDKALALVNQLHAVGIEAWGWHYVYGYDPTGEAQKAVSRVQELNLDGYIIDAEVEYKLPGRDEDATTFMNVLRASLPNLPVGLTSFRFPTIHAEFPWEEFLEKCNYNMPQVYWIYADNPGEQLQRSYNEFLAISPNRPIVPIGPMFNYGDWKPTTGETTEFLNKAKELNMPAASFFTWDYRYLFEDVWDTIGAFSWDGTTPEPEMPQKIINALNSHDPDQLTALYNSDAVHITAAQTVQGTVAIRQWYYNFLNFTLPNATFIISSSSGSTNSKRFTWQAATQSGQIANGNDTIGILNNKIIYHYSYFTIS